MPNLFLGTQGWSYKSWVGSFYPSGISARAYLEHYAAHFGTVELDTTFYAIPRQTTIEGWRRRTPDGFRFAAKFPKVITHEKGLVDCRDETIGFLDRISGLDHKLGPLLLQLPPSYGAAQMDGLGAYLEALPVGFRYALEIRHRSWLEQDTLPKLIGLLGQHAIALCLVQHAWMPKLDEVTAPFVYIRWLGRRQDIPDDDFSKVRIDRSVQLAAWAEQVARYSDANIPVYGYFNNHYQGHSPASVRDLQHRLLDPTSANTA